MRDPAGDPDRGLRQSCMSIVWPTVAEALDAHGAAVLPALLDAGQCGEIARMWNDDKRFRKKIVMQHKGYGAGEYQYFCYPLPPAVQFLREVLYPPLARIANVWQTALRQPAAPYPGSHPEYLARCAAADQARPTPLLLKYGVGDYNCLHQDLYGAEVFPLQVAVLLSTPGQDFNGGEFVLTEQRPRRQSRVEVVPLGLGDAVIFPVHHRPAPGPQGPRKVTMRHGVSRIRSGLRQTLGIIFHDAA